MIMNKFNNLCRTILESLELTDEQLYQQFLKDNKQSNNKDLLIDKEDIIEHLKQLDKYQIFEQVKTYLSNQFEQVKSNFPQLQKAKLQFEDCFEDQDTSQPIFARCSDLKNLVVDINVYRLYDLIVNRQYQYQDIIELFEQYNVIKHEIAHLLDYIDNGDKELSLQHDAQFNYWLKKI